VQLAASRSAYLPLGQAKHPLCALALPAVHAVQSAAPGGASLPAGQFEQYKTDTMPVSGWKVFEGQAVQLPAPASENVPGPHAVHAEEDTAPKAAEEVPAGQDEQVLLPSSNEKVPSGQGGHSARPAGLQLPGLHCAHEEDEDCPAAADALPGSQREHSLSAVRPGAAPNEPLGQSAQPYAPALDQVPEGHCTHPVTVAYEPAEHAELLNGVREGEAVLLGVAEGVDEGERDPEGVDEAAGTRHADTPLGDEAPAGQGMHANAVLAGPCKKVLAGQGVHSVERGALMKPGRQQAPAPKTEKRPAPQGSTAPRRQLEPAGHCRHALAFNPPAAGAYLPTSHSTQEAGGTA
jgi:hypothetical protein